MDADNVDSGMYEVRPWGGRLWWSFWSRPGVWFTRPWRGQQPVESDLLYLLLVCILSCTCAVRLLFRMCLRVSGRERGRDELAIEEDQPSSENDEPSPKRTRRS